jgi:hypothetical protein
MRYLILLALTAPLYACADVPVLTSPEEYRADRAAHQAYLESIYDPEYLADCEYHGLEEC